MKSQLILLMMLLSIPTMSQGKCDQGKNYWFEVEHQYSCKNNDELACVSIGKDEGYPIIVIRTSNENSDGGMFFSADTFTFRDSTLNLTKTEKPLMGQFKYKYVVSMQDDILSFEQFDKAQFSFDKWTSYGPSLYDCIQEF